MSTNCPYRGVAFTILLALMVLQPIAAASGPSGPRPDLASAGDLLQMGGAIRSFKAGASPDTVCLYGGPGTEEGKFQSLGGVIPDLQGWTGVDETDLPTKWQRSTFNSPTGTWAMWAGQDASQEPGWVAAPGYGNSWNVMLEYRKQVGNPGVGQTVDLEFVFNHDVEPGYDYFIVEYDSLSTVQEVYSVTGYNKPSHGSPIFTPLNFPADVTPKRSISYAGGDYAGDANDEIVIRFRVRTDGAWSDQDGLWPTDGAAQVDNILVTSSEGADFEDFEGPGPLYQWKPVKAPYVGDFAQAFARVTDLDPCIENYTPVAGFADDGSGPFNPDYVGPGTGGTSSVNWSYGIPGGWVVNYNGGLTFGSLELHNWIVSPPIAWDLPGTADDSPDFAGAKLRFSAYEHLVLIDGIFRQWSVRSSTDGGTTWSNWDDRSFVYYSNTARWVNDELHVADLLDPNPTHVQIRLGVYDAAQIFAFPGADATVAPVFDNVAFLKYKIAGPSIITRNIDLFQDSFAQSGLTDVSTQAARDLLDVRIDMARDVSTGQFVIVPGDSMVADITSVIPGVTVTDPTTQFKLHYSLNMNPVFEPAIRANAPVTDPGAGINGWDQSQGSVGAYQSTTAVGTPVQDRFAFDLPDENFMYPGDILEYYIEAVDDANNTSILPANLNGFGDGSGSYSRTFTVRALPSYTDSAGNHPEILVWNDFGRRGGEDELYLALNNVGRHPGIHFDVYTTMGPSSRVSNGLGSGGAHGAVAAQLAGYSCIIYEGGDLPNTLEDNDDGSWADKEDDVGLLLTWFDTPGEDRYVAHFADHVASSLQNSAESLSYLSTVLGVQLNDNDVRDEIGGQTAPRVIPTGGVPGLTQHFVAFGGCLTINRFDSIAPGPGAVSAHGFEQLGNPGVLYPGIAASVVWDRVMPDLSRKVSVTFPLGFSYIHDDLGKIGEGSRAIVLEQVFDLFGGHPSGAVTDAAPTQSFQLSPAAPTPFNPRTKLSFVLGRDGVGSVRIFNVRGELVRTLARDQGFNAGLNELVWDGKDDRGIVAASGVYAIDYRIDGFAQTQKVVLLK